MAEPCSIPLGQGFHALVSPEDFERVDAYTWHLKRKTDKPAELYAQTRVRLTPGRDGSKLTVLMHRFILGAERGQQVDHINGNPLDNRRENLRIASNSQNQQNVRHSANQKRGGFKGVYWHKASGKWMASIGCGPLKPTGKRARVYLGLFTEPAEAARAYDRAALEHFGEYAALNFPANDSQKEAL